MGYLPIKKEMGNIFILDPKELTEKDGLKIFSIEDFKRIWKKRYIVIFPI